jgi:hypothetical protein
MCSELAWDWTDAKQDNFLLLPGKKGCQQQPYENLLQLTPVRLGGHPHQKRILIHARLPYQTLE